LANALLPPTHCCRQRTAAANAQRLRTQRGCQRPAAASARAGANATGRATTWTRERATKRPRPRCGLVFELKPTDHGEWMVARAASAVRIARWRATERRASRLPFRL